MSVPYIFAAIQIGIYLEILLLNRAFKLWKTH